MFLFSARALQTAVPMLTYPEHTAVLPDLFHWCKMRSGTKLRYWSPSSREIHLSFLFFPSSDSRFFSRSNLLKCVAYSTFPLSCQVFWQTFLPTHTWKTKADRTQNLIKLLTELPCKLKEPEARLKYRKSQQVLPLSGKEDDILAYKVTENSS